MQNFRRNILNNFFTTLHSSLLSMQHHIRKMNAKSFNLLYVILLNDHDVSVDFRKQGNALAAQLCGIHKLVVIAGGGGERGEEAESMYDRRRPPAPPGEPV